MVSCNGAGCPTEPAVLLRRRTAEGVGASIVLMLVANWDQLGRRNRRLDSRKLNGLRPAVLHLLALVVVTRRLELAVDCDSSAGQSASAPSARHTAGSAPRAGRA